VRVLSLARCCFDLLAGLQLTCSMSLRHCRGWGNWDVARPGLGAGAEAPPPNVILTPHPNELQPMKYPWLATEGMEGECDD